MKIKFLLLAAALTVMAVSCNNKNASSETTETADATAICDSTAAAPVCDTAASAPASSAPAAIPSIEAPAEPVADPKIDKELKEFSGLINHLQSMINQGLDGGVSFGNTLEHTGKLYDKLKSKKSKMTSKQKSRFKKLGYRFTHPKY